MHSSSVFVSSLWEDPGFVIVEAALCNLFVISSNCPNGPKEFLDDGKEVSYLKVIRKKLFFKSLQKFNQMDENKNVIVKEIKKRKKNLQFLNIIFSKILNS